MFRVPISYYEPLTMANKKLDIKRPTKKCLTQNLVKQRKNV